MSAVTAVGTITEKYSYIDFNRIFPKTYRFDYSEKKVWKTTLAVLRKDGMTILEKDREEGFIYTQAKQISITSSDGQTEFKKFYYQYSIFLTSIDKNITYVTCYPTMLEGLNREITLPMARNWLRGIFFGSLAADFYPDKKKESLLVAHKMGKINTSEFAAASYTAETMHIMQPGETLGKVAKKYTGKVMHYKEIADYNNIKNINTIKVGQEIKIPAELLQ